MWTPTMRRALLFCLCSRFFARPFAWSPQVFINRRHPLSGRTTTTTTTTTTTAAPPRKNSSLSHLRRYDYRLMMLVGSESQLASSPPMMELLSPFAIAGLALMLGIAAQSFINQMLEGDQGLGSYLKDGSGYNKSGFRRVDKASMKNDEMNDPLPWLKLPKLDFVDVAGQSNDSNNRQEELVYEKMEQMRLEMNEKLGAGKVEEATAIRNELESIMKEAGIEYRAEE